MGGLTEYGDFAHESILLAKAIDKIGSTYSLRVTSSDLAGYTLSDKDDDASPNYYGYLAKDGSWYIMKETVVAGADTYRFIKGASGYTTNWTNRASLSYDYFNTVFNS